MTQERKHYETETDRRREDWVAKRFALKTGVLQHELPENSRIDRLLTDKNHKPRGWAEIKCRTHECGHYDTYAISETKFKTMLWMKKATNLPVMLVVGFMDLVAWIDVTSLGGLRVVEGGRTDRDDPLDVERVVLIPITKFHYIHPEEEL